ncbi:unnamed protein product [Lampetra fluviatilis]
MDAACHEPSSASRALTPVRILSTVNKHEDSAGMDTAIVFYCRVRSQQQVVLEELDARAGYPMDPTLAYPVRSSISPRPLRQSPNPVHCLTPMSGIAAFPSGVTQTAAALTAPRGLPAAAAAAAAAGLGRSGGPARPLSLLCRSPARVQSSSSLMLLLLLLLLCPLLKQDMR